MRINKIRDIFFIILCIGALFSGAGFATIFIIPTTDSILEIDQQLEGNDYKAVIVSAYENCKFCDTDITSYTRESTVNLNKNIVNMEDFSEVVRTIAKHKKIDRVYLCLNPINIWEYCMSEKISPNIYVKESIGDILKKYKNLHFELILSSPSLDYWGQYSGDIINEIIDVYQILVDECSNYKNVRMFYWGAEKWLNYSNINYEADLMTLNEKITKQLTYFMLCEKKYIVNSENIQGQLFSLKTDIKIKKLGMEKYPDFSEWTIVFFGDSIFGLEETTTSIPAIVGELSNAKTYNLGIGGIAATTDVEINCNFNKMVNAVVYGDHEIFSEYDHFAKETKRFIKEYDESSKLCFVINFGLNDYISGYQINNNSTDDEEVTYKGAMAKGIDKLREKYKDCKIIIMAPTYIELFNAGTEKKGDAGNILLDYIVAAEDVAQKKNTYYLNNYLALNIDLWNYTSYLMDGVHFNGNGRYYFSQRFIEFFEENILSE